MCQDALEATPPLNRTISLVHLGDLGHPCYFKTLLCVLLAFPGACNAASHPHTLSSEKSTKFRESFCESGGCQASQKKGKSGELPGKSGKLLGNPWIAVKFHSERTSGEVAEKLPGKFGELPGKSGDFREARGSLTPSQRLAELVSNKHQQQFMGDFPGLGMGQKPLFMCFPWGAWCLLSETGKEAKSSEKAQTVVFFLSTVFVFAHFCLNMCLTGQLNVCF